jgi:hypothetical protein
MNLPMQLYRHVPRARLSAPLCARACAWNERVRKHGFVCLCARAWDPLGVHCGHSRGPAATCGIYSSARDARVAARACLGLCHRPVFAVLRSVSPARFARVGRRCDVEIPYGQRAVGWAKRPHVRDRRRRRHLRHRRLGQQRRRHHFLQGRVGQHRRGCVTGLAPGVVGAYRVGTQGVLEGTEGALQG